MTTTSGRSSRSSGSCCAWGCVIAVFVFILASTSLYAVDRLVISSSSLDPVEVGGDCPADEVQAFLDGFEDRQEQMLGALEEFDSRSAQCQMDAVIGVS